MRLRIRLSGLCHAITLLLILTSFYCGAQEPVKRSFVKGLVQSNNGELLPGVSVVLRNTKNNFTSGTTTDSSGVFVFNRIPAGGPYTFSFSIVNYDPQTLSGYYLKEDASLSLVVKMNGASATLDQVVVVGYGSQKRKDLTGSVASVSNRDIRDLAVTRVEQALSGKVAGVQVKAVSGEPGVGPQIRVRGIGSISAGAGPLYVVDGFPTDNIQTLNPNDIETLDILKDASATAIYGSRGSNGVVIINTKRGRAGKTMIGFDTYYGWQKILRKPAMKNSLQQAQYAYDGYRNNNLDVGNSVAGLPESWRIRVPQPILDVLSGKNNYDADPLDEILTTAPMQQYQLTAAGGSENVRFAIAGEYLNTDGIILNSGFKRYSLRANFDAKLNKRISVKLNLNPSYTNKMALPVYTGGEGNLIGSALGTFNWIPLREPAGGYTLLRGRADLSEINNPLAVLEQTITKQNTLRFLGNLSAEYRIMNGLNLNVMAGANLVGMKGMIFTPQLPVFLNVPAVGTDNATLISNWITEYTLNYNRSFGKHNLTALAGYTQQKEIGSTNLITSNKYPNNLVPTLSAVSGLITGGSSDEYQWSLRSYLGRLNYNYDNKYYLTTSMRSDGSSRFGANNKYAFFPSLALAWRVKGERFLERADFIDELKLRGSYGKSGNNNIGNYESYATINYEKYVLGNTAVSGFSQARLDNPSLTWEKQEQVNVGLDLAVWKSRVRLTVDHFRSTNTDLLLNVNIPSTTGFSNSLQNIGEVSNNGWEFVLNTTNVNRKFTWTTDLNFSTYRNKVEKLGPSGDPIYTDNNITLIGQPIGMFYGLKLDGVFRNQSELSKGPVWNPGAADRSRVGDFRFVDVSGPNGKPDGIISSADYTIIGSPYPDFYYGMTNNFAYQQFSLSVNLQGTHGSQIYNQSRAQGNSGRGRLRSYAFSNDYWKSEQQPGDGQTQRPNNAPTGGARAIGQQFLDTGSFLRFNNIIASYALPARITRRLGINTGRIYVNATNPILITKYTAFNPDVSLSENPLTPGLERNDYPVQKSIIIGLNVTF